MADDCGIPHFSRDEALACTSISHHHLPYEVTFRGVRRRFGNGLHQCLAVFRTAASMNYQNLLDLDDMAVPTAMRLRPPAPNWGAAATRLLLFVGGE